MLNKLNSQRSKNGQFSKRIVDRNSVLSNHQFDETCKKSGKKVGKNENEKKEETTAISFYQFEYL